MRTLLRANRAAPDLTLRTLPGAGAGPTARPDAFDGVNGATTGRPTRTTFGRGPTSVLLSTLAVAVFAVHLGCQSPGAPGAPIAADEPTVETTTDAGKPAEGHVLSPHGDFEALPAPGRRTTPAEGHTLSPSGDFEAMPAPLPRDR